MSNINNDSIRSNNPQHRPSSPQHNNSNAVQQQTAGTASRTPQTPEEQVFQNPHILSRIIELSDSPFIAAKNLRTVNNAFRQASIISQQGQSLKEFTAQDLLDAFSEDPQTHNNSSLHNYLRKAPKDSPLPDIDITLSPQDLKNNDILSALRKLQSSDKTSPIKAIIEVNNPSELQSLINAQLPFLQKISSLFRAICIKEEVSVQQLQNEIATLAKKLKYTTDSQLTPTIKQFPLRISLYTPTFNNFLTTDFSTLAENLLITQVEIDRDRESSLKETLTNAENPQFQQQLNNLKHATTLNLKVIIAKDATLTVPPSVTTLSTDNIQGTLQFAPGSQCSTLSLCHIWRSSTVTIPASVTTLTTGNIQGTLQFAPGSQCSSLSLGGIQPDTTVTIPASVTTLTTNGIEGTLQFAPDSQCSTLSLGYIGRYSTVTIPASVTTLSTGNIDGTLQFAPGSQCSTLSLGYIYSQATVTIPASVTTLTIYDTPYTGQELLNLKSGKTSIKNVTFEQ